MSIKDEIIQEEENIQISKDNYDLKVKFSRHRGKLVISFTPPAENLVMTYSQARDFARRIVQETMK